MSRIGRAAARLALRLYPTGWRDRYQAEVLTLIDDSDSGLTDAADLAGSALCQHATGGAPMRFAPAHRHPRAFATAAAVVLLPTLAVVALSLLGHELGVTAVASAVDPVLTWVNTVRIVDLALVLAPAVALLLSVLPLVDLQLQGEAAEQGVTLRLRARAANLVVAAASLAAGAVLAWHIVVESALQRGG